MNRTLRTALVASALTVGALTLTTGVAHAEPKGPQVVDKIAVPTPTPKPTPKPKGPGDLATIPCPTHGGCNPGPKGPGDLADRPDVPGDDNTPHDGPGDVTSNPPCPTHGPCGGSDVPVADPGLPLSDVPLPTRIDTGLGGETEDGLAFAFLLASGALVTVAGGGALAARARR